MDEATPSHTQLGCDRTRNVFETFDHITSPYLGLREMLHSSGNDQTWKKDLNIVCNESVTQTCCSDKVQTRRRLTGSLEFELECGVVDKDGFPLEENQEMPMGDRNSVTKYRWRMSIMSL